MPVERQVEFDELVHQMEHDSRVGTDTVVSWWWVLAKL